MQSIWITWLAILVVCSSVNTLLAPSNAFAKDVKICERVRETTTSMRAEYPDDSDYASIRDRLLRSLATEAIRQATGLTIRAYVSANTEMQNDSFDESLLERMLEKSTGRLTGYRILKEEIIPAQEGNERFLAIQIIAKVCAPPPEALPEIVAVGAFLDTDGSHLPARRSQILKATPQTGPLLLSNVRPSEGYHDIAVIGRIERIDDIVVDNTSKKAMMAAYVSEQTLATIPDEVRRISVNVSMTADLLGSGQQVTETVLLHEDIPLQAAASSALNPLIDEAIEEVSANLFARLSLLLDKP